MVVMTMLFHISHAKPLKEV